MAEPGTDPLLAGGMILSIFGALNSAIGTYFDLSSQRLQMKSQAESMRHQQAISEINTRTAEMRRFGVLEAGQRELAAHGLQVGQMKSRQLVDQAASGVDLGSASAVEARASADILAKIGRYNIEANIARSAAAARMQRVDLLNQATAAGISARNLGASAGTISPAMGLSTSLLSDVGTLAREWRYAQRRRV